MNLVRVRVRLHCRDHINNTQPTHPRCIKRFPLLVRVTGAYDSYSARDSKKEDRRNVDAISASVNPLQSLHPQHQLTSRYQAEWACPLSLTSTFPHTHPNPRSPIQPRLDRRRLQARERKAQRRTFVARDGGEIRLARRLFRQPR